MAEQESRSSVLLNFWKEKYLQEYIAGGGSKIKFVSGRTGSGKTYFLEQMTQAARQEQYLTASFSAKDIWLNDFKEIYAEIFRQCDLMHCLEGCAREVIKKTGYHPEDIPAGMNFMDYLSSCKEGDALTRREIRAQLKQMFLDNPVLDNNFALACSLLTGGILGHPVLERSNRELLLSWLEGDKTVKLSLLRPMGLSPARITKYNARHMLRSLSEVVHLSGYAGVFVTIDDLEILLNHTTGSEFSYTRVRREDTYESIRQMVDDIDNMTHIMFVIAFDRALIDDEKYGVKSYQALWMRIQNEVVGEHFNCFADIVDMDRMQEQVYDPPTLIEISTLMADLERKKDRKYRVITEGEAKDIIEQAKTGAVGMPGLVRSAMAREPKEETNAGESAPFLDAAKKETGGESDV